MENFFYGRPASSGARGMRRPRWQIRPGAALGIALLYFYDRRGYFSALLPAALCHELGHILALLGFGARIRGVNVGFFGLELVYAGALRKKQTLLALAAGPLAGLLYGAAAWRLGGPFFRFSGALSLTLSFYNALPILPLDGGRMLWEFLDPESAEHISRTAACVFLCLTALLMGVVPSPFPLLAALWLFYLNVR